MKFDDIMEVGSNFYAVLRERGKIVPGSVRQGHNVFTITGRNWLSKLASWSAIGPPDVPFTSRRVRWMGLGIGVGLEVTSVTSLVQPVLATVTDYLVAIDTVEFPTSTSVRYIREFGTAEITTGGSPVSLTEAGMFVDIDPATAGGSEDVAAPSVTTTLDPSVSTNPPVSYKAFDPITKTVDFTLEIRWDYRF